MPSTTAKKTSRTPKKSANKKSAARMLSRRRPFSINLIAVVAVAVVLGGYVLLAHSLAAGNPPEVENAGFKGMCLDDYQNKSAGKTAAKVDLYKCNGTAAQQWTWGKTLDKNWKQIIIHNQCLDIYHAQAGIGSKLDLFTCKPTGTSSQIVAAANQFWYQDSRGRLITALPDSAGANLCTAPVTGSNNAEIQLVPCNLDPSQIWNFNTYPPADASTALSSGPAVGGSTPGVGSSPGTTPATAVTTPVARTVYEVASGVVGKCLDDFHNQVLNFKSNPVVSYQCNATDAQKWTVSSGKIMHRGQCLDVYQGGTKPHTHVDQYNCKIVGNANQLWRYNTSTHQLSDSHSKLCLTVPTANAATNGSVQLQIDNCSSSNVAQRWFFQPPKAAAAGGGAGGGGVNLGLVQIKGPNNLCVEATSAAARMFTCGTNAGQQWKPVAVNAGANYPGTVMLELDGGSNCLHDNGKTGVTLDVEVCGDPNAQVFNAGLYYPNAGQLQDPGLGLCVTATNNALSLGNTLQLQPCQGLVSQKWFYQ